MTQSLPSLSTDGVISEPNVHRIQQYPQISGLNCEVLTSRGKNVFFILKLISMLNYRRNFGLQQSGLNSEVVLFPGWSYCEVLLYYTCTVCTHNIIVYVLYYMYIYSTCIVLYVHI